MRLAALLMACALLAGCKHLYGAMDAGFVEARTPQHHEGAR